MTRYEHEYLNQSHAKCWELYSPLQPICIEHSTYLLFESDFTHAHPNLLPIYSVFQINGGKRYLQYIAQSGYTKKSFEGHNNNCVEALVNIAICQFCIHKQIYEVLKFG